MSTGYKGITPMPKPRIALTNPHDLSADFLSLTPVQKIGVAIQELLIEKGIIAPDELSQSINLIDMITPAQGSRVVARAWVDASFKERLLTDAVAACLEVEIDIRPIHLIVIENTSQIHNVIVCTLCSCYPRMLLGLPPDWYKSSAYRARVIHEPRTVLQEFGTHLKGHTQITVHDSTADMRYMVLPIRPVNTDNMKEDELAELVTRDCMIGVKIPQLPSDFSAV